LGADPKLLLLCQQMQQLVQQTGCQCRVHKLLQQQQQRRLLLLLCRRHGTLPRQPA
jgi:hypothetical protein